MQHNGEAERGSGLLLLLAVLLLVVLALTGAGCKRKHVPVDAVPDVPYPTCGGSEDAGAGALLASRKMRGERDSMAESEALESFELRRRGCLLVATVHQEWKRGSTDVEVVFDERWVPLRAWKRMTVPGSKRADGNADIRRYELRTPDVTIKKSSSSGAVEYELLRGVHPTAVIGPGRGLLTAWIRKAKLGVGEKVREPVLDFREMVEVIRDVTLKRENDRFDPALKRNVRVYTVYGREAVFTDDDDVILGDLAGLRPSEMVLTPEPPAAPTFGAPDPVSTP